MTSDSELQLQINYRLMEKLASSEKRYRDLIERTQAVIFETDSNGDFSFLNGSWDQLTGINHQNAIGCNISQWLSREVDHALVKSISSGRACDVSGEIRLQHIDGSFRWAMLSWQKNQAPDDGNSKGSGSLFDISDRKKTEQRLQESMQEARKLSMVASHTDNLVIITDASGRIEWVNTGFELATGYSADEARGNSPGKLLQGEKTDKAAVALMRNAVNQGLGFKTEVLNYSRDGSCYWVAIEATPVHGDDGKLTNFIAIERDITERRNNSRLLIAAKDAAEALAGDRALFVANMSHEIRTPLNAIIGMSELLINKELSPHQLELAECVFNASTRLSALIDNVLDYSRLKAGAVTLESRPVNIREQISAVCTLLRPEAELKSLTLVLTDNPTNHQGSACNLTQVKHNYDGLVLADSCRLDQIFTNLISNAIKFTGHGEVTIETTQNRLADDMIHCSIVIRDSGIGLPENGIEDLLQPFTQADASTTRKFGGTGLGLAICGKLVEAMNGSLTAKNCPTGGSEFSLTFHFKAANKSRNVPYKETASLSTASVIAQSTNADGIKSLGVENQSFRLLVVEDNLTNQKVVRLQLENFGHQVSIANNGWEACQTVLKEKFDAVLMDIQMPVLDGLEACRFIRLLEQRTGSKNRLPIIALTAGALKTDRQQCLQAGMDGFISKPATASSIQQTLINATSKSGSDSAVDTTMAQNWLSHCANDHEMAQELLDLTRSLQQSIEKNSEVTPSSYLSHLINSAPDMSELAQLRHRLTKNT